MNDGAFKDYEFSQKNNWRRQVWKWISKRVNPSRAKCLVLSGSSCLDIPAMRFRGFLLNNVVSVERDRAAAREARKTYPILVYNGSIGDFLLFADPAMTFDVIFLDFCGGYTDERLDELKLAINRLNTRGILGANFLRGRDEFIYRWGERTQLYEKHGRHRGKFMAAYLSRMMGDWDDTGVKVERGRKVKECKWWSYKSGPVYMDSFVQRMDLDGFKFETTPYRTVMETRRLIEASAIYLLEDRDYMARAVPGVVAMAPKILDAAESIAKTQRLLAAARAVQSKALA